MTYMELNTLANRFASILMALKPDVRSRPYVGILSSVRPESIAALLGALKLGCAYVPLDEQSPNERLASIVEKAQLDVLVVEDKWYHTHVDLLQNAVIQNVALLGNTPATPDKKCLAWEKVLAAPSDEPPPLHQVSDALAYILHSSGSTGVPKGIMLSHRNARTFVDWMQREFKLTSADRVLSYAPLKFDLSVFDIFNTLNAGATLLCFDWNGRPKERPWQREYVSFMELEGATMLYATPSTLISLMNHGALSEARLRLRQVMYAGEPFAVAQLRKFHRLVPGARIANIYGPTETNIITCYRINQIPDDDSAAIPLGKEVDDTEIIIVSACGKHLCAVNEVGEIWCRGGTVTAGYLGMDASTKERSVLSPFHPYPARFWRTGDFGYRDTMGCLHYRGRADNMIKVKGYRIELGEIETAAAAHPHIDEVTAVALPDAAHGHQICCFYSHLQRHSLTDDDLRAFLSRKLPLYMIPARFVCMHALPKTSSGKIDRMLLTRTHAA